MTEFKPPARTAGQSNTEIQDMAEHRQDERNIYLTLHRTFNAPVEKVYAAWTEPELLCRWFSPGDTVVTRAVAEVTVGGTFLIEMRRADGKRRLTRGLYREVVPNCRLVHTWCWDDSDVESLVTVEFEPGPAGTTRLTLTHSRFAQIEARDEHQHGWSGCLGKLQALFTGRSVYCGPDT